MNHSAYQRFVFGYHGCDASVADQAILNGKHLSPSENDYDWLGKGIYFWEHGHQRAPELAPENRASSVAKLKAYADCKGFEVVEVSKEQISGMADESDRHGLHRVEELARTERETLSEQIKSGLAEA